MTVAILSAICVLAVGLLLYGVVRAWLDRYFRAVEELARRDPVAAMRGLLDVIALMLALSGAMAIGFGIWIFYDGWRMARAERWPPSGRRVYWRVKILDGKSARRRGRVLMALALILVTLVPILGWKAYRDLGSFLDAPRPNKKLQRLPPTPGPRGAKATLAASASPVGAVTVTKSARLRHWPPRSRCDSESGDPSFLPPEETKGIIDTDAPLYLKYNGFTAAAIRARLPDIRERRFALDDGMLVAGISALAVPILPRDRDAIASIAINMTSARLQPERLPKLLDSLFRYPGVPEEWRQPDFSLPSEPTLELRLRKSDLELGFLTTLTVFSAPQNVTLEELRLESYFPLDEPTTRACQRLALAAADA